MLIDAWRSEFLFGSHENNHMPFLNRLRLFDHVSSYNAHLQPPTVTMPRIKAITAGIIPSFVDVLLNFASDSMNDDNIIDRLWKSGRRLMFCGDDTWLKLFPGRFLDRSEGIVSFYVNDYIEVDNNVTLCLKKELTNETISTWDVMILHYLGLDHIGHSLGGESNILHTKLKEMDGIIENIYDTLVRVHNSNFSMLIFGDHGMTEAGNHGGSSEKEVNVPLIYIDGQRIQGARSILFSAIYSIEQIDIVPTLASIFNFEIPVKSLGITFVDQLVPRKRKKDYLMPLVSLLKNSYQITGLLDVANAHLNNCIEDCIKNLEGFCHKRNLSQISLASNIASCKKSLHSVQEKLMTKEAAFKSFSYIFLGICISIMVSCISIWLLFSTVAIAQTVAKTHNEPFMNANGKQRKRKVKISSAFFYIFPLINVSIFFSSSFIEEEHDVQYFLFSSYLFVRFCENVINWLNSIVGCGAMNTIVTSEKKRRMFKTPIITTIFALLVHRICSAYKGGFRRRWIMEKDNINMLQDHGWKWSLYRHITSIDSSFQSDLSEILKNWLYSGTVINIAAGAVIIFHIFLFLRRYYSFSCRLLFDFMLMIANFVFVIFRHFASEWFVCFFAFISSFTHLILFGDPVTALMLWQISIIRRNLLLLLTLQIFLGILLSKFESHSFAIIFAIFSSFFYSGNSNNFSTIDISVGYNCLSSYQPVVIIFQLALNIFAMPLTVFFSWFRCLNLAKNDSLNDNKSDKNYQFSLFFIYLFFIIFLRLTICMLSLFFHRYHLFIWSVFAPKLVYETAHLLFLISVLFFVNLLNFCDYFCSLWCIKS